MSQIKKWLPDDNYIFPKFLFQVLLLMLLSELLFQLWQYLMHTFVSSKRIRALRRIHIEQILKSSSGSVYPCSGKITGSEIHFSALILFYVCLSFSLFDYLSLFVCLFLYFTVSQFLRFSVCRLSVCLFVCCSLDSLFSSRTKGYPNEKDNFVRGYNHNHYARRATNSGSLRMNNLIRIPWSLTFSVRQHFLSPTFFFNFTGALYVIWNIKVPHLKR